jgi:hypothetical protein
VLAEVLPAVPEWNETERGAIVVPRFFVILKIVTIIQRGRRAAPPTLS